MVNMSCATAWPGCLHYIANRCRGLDLSERRVVRNWFEHLFGEQIVMDSDSFKSLLDDCAEEICRARDLAEI